MFLANDFVRRGAIALVTAATTLQVVPAHADGEFPFGLEMTLDAPRQPGSKRIPTLEIGDNGEAVLELWGKGGKGQVLVGGDTVIFLAGELGERARPAPRGPSPGGKGAAGVAGA